MYIAQLLINVIKYPLMLANGSKNSFNNDFDINVLKSVNLDLHPEVTSPQEQLHLTYGSKSIKCDKKIMRKSIRKD